MILNRRVYIQFALALSILGVMTLATALSVGNYVKGIKLAAHTREVIKEITDVQLDITAAETGQRGYIITGKAMYAAPYTEAKQKLVVDLQKVRTLTSDNPAQQENVAKLVSLIERRMITLESNMDIRRSKTLLAAANAIYDGDGLDTMMKIRALTDAMIAHEMDLLSGREQADTARLSYLIAILAAGDLASVGLLYFAGHKVFHAAQAKIAAEASLRKHASLLTTFVTNIPVAIVMTDTHMNILAVSDEWRRRFGTGDKEIVGHNYYEVAAVPEQWKANHQLALTQGKNFDYRDDSLVVNGKTEYVNRRLVPWYMDGKIAGLITVTQFITNEINARAELERIHVQIDELEVAKDDLLMLLGQRKDTAAHEPTERS